MRTLRKIIPYDLLSEWRFQLSSVRTPLVVTNGCFDCLHVGHIHLLESAREMGQTLLVGVTSDAGIRHLKGPSRPILAEKDRAALLAALEMIDFVSVFPEVDATAFLCKAKPDIYVKGSDYTIDTINQEERAVLNEIGARIAFVSRYEQRSTSGLIRQIMAQSGPQTPF